MILFDFAVVYWFCCYDELRWEAPDREKGEDLGRMPRYAASRATDAIARASEKWRRFGADAGVRVPLILAVGAFAIVHSLASMVVS